MSDIETIDLVHKYLVERRILGISRTVYPFQKDDEQSALKMIHYRLNEIVLAEIVAENIIVKISSPYMSKLVSKHSGFKTLCKFNMSDPQSLSNIENILEKITEIFNKFVEDLNCYESSIHNSLTFPSNKIIPHRFKI